MSRWLPWVVVAVVAAGCVLGFLFTRPAAPLASSSPSPTETGTRVVAASEARQLEADLSSGKNHRIREALAIPDGEKLDAKFFTRFSGLGRITIREDSAVRLDDTSARVYAGVEHSQVKTWTLLLTSVGGKWRVASTIEGEQR